MLLIFVLMFSGVLGLLRLFGDDEVNDNTVAAVTQNNSIFDNRFLQAIANPAGNSAQCTTDEVIQALEKREIVFSHNAYNFTYTFAYFLCHIDDDFAANFDMDKIYNVLKYIDAQVGPHIEIDIETAKYDAMAILSGAEDDYIVVLTLEWARNPNLINKDLLGTFYTYFNEGETGRNGNIRRAAGLVDNYVLLPGQAFSMNEAIAPVCLSNGYYIALVIANGEFVEGIGGGVCQVSSTLYMAALFAELEILQRRAHSRMVGYVPPAFDSVLATPYLDLRFRNNTPSAITIETRFDISNNRITVNIWGQETRPAGRTISFESVQMAANNSYVTYHLYKIENNNGVRTRTRVNISTYRAEQEGVITYYEAIADE